MNECVGMFRAFTTSGQYLSFLFISSFEKWCIKCLLDFKDELIGLNNAQLNEIIATVSVLTLQ